MADAFTERLTGQAHADDVSIEVGLVMTDTALLDGHDTPRAAARGGPAGRDRPGRVRPPAHVGRRRRRQCSGRRQGTGLAAPAVRVPDRREPGHHGLATTGVRRAAARPAGPPRPVLPHAMVRRPRTAWRPHPAGRRRAGRPAPTTARASARPATTPRSCPAGPPPARPARQAPTSPTQTRLRLGRHTPSGSPPPRDTPTTRRPARSSTPWSHQGAPGPLAPRPRMMPRTPTTLRTAECLLEAAFHEWLEQVAYVEPRARPSRPSRSSDSCRP